MEVCTCDSVSYVVCRNLAFLMLDLETSIAKKVAKAKQEAEVKSVLLEQFGQMSAEQLAGLLELAKTGTAG